MKKPILLLTGTILAVTAYLTIPRIIKSNSGDGFNKEEEFEHENEGGEEDEKESGAASQLMSWFQAKGYPDASNLSSKYQAAWEQYLELKSKSNPVYRGQSASNWAALGYCLNSSGTRIGGRIVCMAIDPNNTNNLWVGSASGGIWKSTNAGSSWTNVVTNLPVLGVSSIIINPSNSNEIYAGTGEVYHTEVGVMGFNVWKTRGTYGIGVIKSTDGGNTWTQVMPKNSSDLFAVSSMAFLPGTPTTVFACATDGLYRSTNSGTSWSKIYNGNNIRDIAINPSNTNIIVISVGNMTNPTKGIFRTTNGSNALPTWGKISSGLPSSFDGYINMDNAGAGMLVASVGTSSGTTNNEIYRSTDFGATWSVQSGTNHCDYQFWFAHTAAVNPFFTDSIIYGGVNLYRSGTGSRSTISGPHADQHDVKFDPVRRGYVYVCNDGGVYKSTNGGSSFTAINNGLNATQFYASLGVSKTNANRMAGGLQDNGQVIYDGTNWNQVSWAGGDGTSCAISPSNDNNILVSRDARQIYRSTNGGSSGAPVTNYWGFAADSRTAFVAPIAFAPSDGTIVYQASDNLHKSTNSGSPFTNNTYSSATNYIEAIHKTAIALAVSPTNSNKVYVSTSPYAQYDNDVNNIYVTGTPNILKSTTGNTPFTSIKGSLPDRFVMDFAISKYSDDSVYIVLGGFGSSHVYLTPDGGTTWLSRGAGLPDVPFNAIIIDPVNPKTIYAGCDFGVYVSPDRGTTWYDYNSGFNDATLIMDLQIDANNKLIAATHGKGVFRSDLYTYTTLPVVLNDFNGQVKDNQNLLQWLVDQEQGLDRYELERSTDGSVYTKIYTVSAQGKTSYSYSDRRPLFEGYYRLKMIDIDGTIKYSSVIFLRQILKKAEFSVMGNPFKDNIVVKYKIAQQGPIEIMLYSQSGALLKREEYNTPAGNGIYKINGFERIASGAYFLKIIYNKESQTIKLQKL